MAKQIHRSHVAGMFLLSALGLTGATTAPVPPHVADAQKLVAGLVDQDNAGNSYSYALPPTISWGPTFANADDCSTFFTALIEHAYGLTAADVERLAGTTRATGPIKAWPQAQTWYAAVKNGTPGACLPAVATVTDLTAGDMIFLRYASGTDATGDTGHVMLIAAAPVRLTTATAPVEAGTTEYTVDIIDSTGDPHGTDDTRYHATASGASATGVGAGTIRLYANADGTPAGHTWSPLAGSVYESMAAQPMAFARPSPTAMRALAGRR